MVASSSLGVCITTGIMTRCFEAKAERMSDLLVLPLSCTEWFVQHKLGVSPKPELLELTREAIFSCEMVVALQDQ